MSPALPEALERLLEGFSCRPVEVGLSGAGVLRLERDGEAAYLKRAPVSSDPDPGFSLRAEAERLPWLGARGLPVPRVLAFLEHEGVEHLLTAALPGQDASQPWPPEAREAVVRALAEELRRLHATSIAGCPFDERLDVKLERARRRLEEGLVDAEDLDEERLGRDPWNLYAELLETRPADEDLVLTHGDYCLPNVVLENGSVGFVDLGRAGVADRHQDLALMTRSLAADYNPQFGPVWARRFLEFYDGPVDPAKLTFYRLLDEFF